MRGVVESGLQARWGDEVLLVVVLSDWLPRKQNKEKRKCGHHARDLPPVRCRALGISIVRRGNARSARVSAHRLHARSRCHVTTRRSTASKYCLLLTWKIRPVMGRLIATFVWQGTSVSLTFCEWCLLLAHFRSTSSNRGRPGSVPWSRRGNEHARLEFMFYVVAFSRRRLLFHRVLFPFLAWPRHGS